LTNKFKESVISHRHRLLSDMRDIEDVIHVTDFGNVESLNQLLNRLGRVEKSIEGIIDTLRSEILLAKAINNAEEQEKELDK
jgi:hypothetical protein